MKRPNKHFETLKKKLAIFTASDPTATGNATNAAAVNLTGNATKAVNLTGNVIKAVVEEVYDVIADDLPDLKNRTFKVHILD